MPQYLVPVNAYIAGTDRYEVDVNGEIIEFGSRNLRIGNEGENFINNTSRYNQQELEAMAGRPDMDLEKLTLTRSNEGTNYFLTEKKSCREQLKKHLLFKLDFLGEALYLITLTS